MTTPERPAPQPITRRGVLAVGMLAPVAGVALAGCTTESERPDPLLPLLSAARADAATAEAAARQYPSFSAARTVASVRTEHAEALQREVRRASTATSTPTTQPAAGNVSGGESAAQEALRASLRRAQGGATTLVPELPRYRAGLVGSVAAGCASLLEGMS